MEPFIERQLAESALRESQTRLHTVVTQAPIILYATDSNGTLTLLEGKGLERMGHPPGKVLRQSDFDLYGNQLKILENLPDVLEGADSAWVVNVGDSVYQNRATPLRDTNDQVTGLIGVATDITQRHQAESALAERERYLAALVEVQRRLLALKGEENYYNSILEPLVEASSASHVYVFDNSCDADEQQLLTQRAKWCASEISCESNNPKCQNLPYN